MKRNIIISVLISIVVNMLAFIINFACGYFNGFLPLSTNLGGGDAVISVGFGIKLTKFYPEILNGVENATANDKIDFDPISLIITFVLLFIIVFIIKSIITKKKV